VTRRRSQVGFARCSVCDRQSFARTTPSNRTTNRGSGENGLPPFEDRGSGYHFAILSRHPPAALKVATHPILWVYDVLMNDSPKSGVQTNNNLLCMCDAQQTIKIGM